MANKYSVVTIRLDGNAGLDRPECTLYREDEFEEVRDLLTDFIDYSYLDPDEYPDPHGSVVEWDGESPIYFESGDGESIAVDIITEDA